MLDDRLLFSLSMSRAIHEGFEPLIDLVQAGIFAKERTSSVLLDNATKALIRFERLESEFFVFERRIEATMMLAASSGGLDIRHLECLVRGVIAFFPYRNSDEPQGVLRLYDEMSAFIRSLCGMIMQRFTSMGVGLHMAPLSTIASFAATRHDASLFEWALDLKASHSLKSEELSKAIILDAGGSFQKAGRVWSAWTSLCAKHYDKITNLQWETFAVAAHKSEVHDYFREQVKQFDSNGQSPSERYRYGAEMVFKTQETAHDGILR